MNNKQLSMLEGRDQTPPPEPPQNVIMPSQGEPGNTPHEPQDVTSVMASIRSELPRTVRQDVADVLIQTLFTDDPQRIDQALNGLIGLREDSDDSNP